MEGRRETREIRDIEIIIEKGPKEREVKGGMKRERGRKGE